MPLAKYSLERYCPLDSWKFPIDEDRNELRITEPPIWIYFTAIIYLVMSSLALWSLVKPNGLSRKLPLVWFVGLVGLCILSWWAFFARLIVRRAIVFDCIRRELILSVRPLQERRISVDSIIDVSVGRVMPHSTKIYLPCYGLLLSTKDGKTFPILRTDRKEHLLGILAEIQKRFLTEGTK
jgi:hypothetical protein